MAPFTKGPIEAVLALMEEGHYPQHVENTLKAMGFRDLPAKMSLSRDAVLAEYIQVQRQHETHTQDEAIARAIARVAWRQHVVPKAHPEFVKRIDRDRRLLWAWRIAILLVGLAILGLLFSRPAHAQIDVIKFQDSGGAALKTYAAPFTIKCSTNITCTPTGSTMAISASSTASTAWSAITAAANVNPGAFSSSGNSWDFTGATFFKLRVGAGLTTSANGDIGQNSTDGAWHAWVNGADRLFIGSTNKGAAGQVSISNADGTASFADPIVSSAYVNLWTTQDVTVTRTSAVVRVPTFSQYGTLLITFASVTGSPASCTIQIKSADSVGNLLNNGSAVSVTVANGTTSQTFSPAAALGTSSQMQAVFACVTYPTAGTLTLDFSPASTTYVPNTVAVSGTFWQATQPVSGTFWQATQPVSGTVTANQGGTWTVQPGNTANTTAWKVDGSAVTQPVSGTVTANIGTSGSLALDASVTGLEVAQGSTTSGQKGILGQGAVTTSAPTYTTAQTSPLSLTTAGALRTDSSAVTQPVSGTVTANEGGTWTVQPGNTANTTPWLTTDSASSNTGSAVPAKASYAGANGSGNLTGIIGCDNSTFLDMTTATTTQLVALTSGKVIYVCHYAIESNGTASVKLVYGTGTNCATGQTQITPNYDWVAQTGISTGSGLGMITKTAASNALCATSSAAVNVHVEVTYTQF